MTMRVFVSYLCLGLMALFMFAVSVSMLIVPNEKLKLSGQISVFNSKDRLFRTEEKSNYAAKEFDVIQGEFSESVKERNYILAFFGFLGAGSLLLVVYRDHQKRTLTSRCTGADYNG